MLAFLNRKITFRIQKRKFEFSYVSENLGWVRQVPEKFLRGSWGSKWRILFEESFLSKKDENHEKNVFLYNYIGFLRVPELQSVANQVRNFFDTKKLSSRILRPEWSQELSGFQVHFEVLKIWFSKFSESLIVRMSRIHPRNFEELWRTLSNLFANPFKMSKIF